MAGKVVRTMTPEQEAEWEHRARRGDLGFATADPRLENALRERYPSGRLPLGHRNQLAVEFDVSPQWVSELIKRIGFVIDRQPPADHGTVSKYSHGCRCGFCRAASTAYHRERRRRRREATRA